MSFAIILDFDGVLADTEDLLFSIFKDVKPSLSKRDFLLHHEANIYLEPKIDISPKEMDYIYSEYSRRLNKDLSICSQKLLYSIPQNTPIFIISSNDEGSIKLFLSELGILSRFKKVLGYQSGKSKKNKIDSIINENNFSANAVIFVTDTLGDLKESAECGVKTIAVQYGFHSLRTLKKGNPSYLAKNPDDLCRIIFEQCHLTSNGNTMKRLSK